MLLDFLLVVLGFCLIVVIHELGHFLAAKWAGIRVLAFAVGFGPAILTYRQGMGIRRGSSEAAYLARLKAAGGSLHSPPSILPGVSPTEYRLNVLPLGGYVKMLGQVDGDPGQISEAPDGYQRCVAWKRMVVISAGVVANIILAAGLFMVVFLAGLKTEPATIGLVLPGSPAAEARVVDAAGRDAAPGLHAGDRVVEIGGRTARSFNDIVLATAMAHPDELLRVRFERNGQSLTGEIKPRPGARSGLLEIGIEPARTTRLLDLTKPRDIEQFRAAVALAGLPGVEPGMTLARVNGASIATLGEVDEFAARAGPAPLALEFVAEDGRSVTASLTPIPSLQTGFVPRETGVVAPIDHLLGLVPVMSVGDARPDGPGPKAADQGLEDGDLFARIGDVEYPGIADGIRAIRSRAGQTVEIVVLRRTDDGAWREVQLPKVRVSAQGTIGFGVSDRRDVCTLLAIPPPVILAQRDDAQGTPPAASRVVRTPGVEVVAVNGVRTPDFTTLRETLRAATADAAAGARTNPDASATVTLTLRRPVAGLPDPEAPTEDEPWTLGATDLKALHALGWRSPLPPGLFEMDTIVLRADGPFDAIVLGVRETHRVMMSTYLTFARLAQGTVKVEHLKGPVGIAHLGTLIAGRGFIWLLFFLALISVNLAVINFLPLPIVDGGQFLFLLYEQVRGRPAPIALQNALAIAGLALIVSVFLIVTFNDVRALLGL